MRSNVSRGPLNAWLDRLPRPLAIAFDLYDPGADVARMVEAAKQFGANAIVGMRFDVRGVTAAWNEVCAYGTAVLLMPVGGAEPEAQPSLNPMSISAIEGDAVPA